MRADANGGSDMFTASELFDLAIQVEVNGELFYRYALEKMQGPVKDVLLWLAEQESEHRSVFLDIKERLCGKETSGPEISGASRTVLQVAMGRHAFSLDELDLDSIQDKCELLRAAISFEEDAIAFFELMSSFVSDTEAIATIEKIRREELNHKRMLLEKLSEQ